MLVPGRDLPPCEVAPEGSSKLPCERMVPEAEESAASLPKKPGITDSELNSTALALHFDGILGSCARF